ncbi:hypothetical protein [Nocardia jiangsuensis]|uniref:Activator of Hsp90 ATPase-like protein n=1 Tax=Nocardia jiangsuensis TaxID=1691563 RepID=A0ABV8DN89_9NOCA
MKTDSLPEQVPVVHRNLTVTVGSRTFATLTRDHLHYWLNRLPHARGGPFMTVIRPGRAGFIQTYRNSDTDYLLEVHGHSDTEFLGTTVADLATVEQLIWDWLEGDLQRLDAIAWNRERYFWSESPGAP